MDRKKFLKPFAASIATLLIGAQAGASLPANLAAQISNPQDVTATSDGVTLSKSDAGMHMAAHQSHSSHSSHSSHASHASHSSSSF